MKSNILKIIILLVVFCGSTIAQNIKASQSSALDIRSMVQQQIDEAKQKELLQIKSKSDSNSNKQLAKNTNAVDNKLKIASDNNTTKLNEATLELPVVTPQNISTKTGKYRLIGYMLFGVASALLIMFAVVMKKRMSSIRVDQKKILKKYIKGLREESLILTKPGKLTSLRNKLLFKTNKINKNGKAITSAAKKMSIAKGELQLAMKLNLMSGSNQKVGQ